MAQDIHSLPHSLTHSLTHPPTHPPTHPSTHPPTHSLTHPPTHALTHAPTHPPTHSLIHSLILIFPTTPLFGNFPKSLNSSPHPPKFRGEGGHYGYCYISVSMINDKFFKNIMYIPTNSYTSAPSLAPIVTSNKPLCFFIHVSFSSKSNDLRAW